MNTGAERRERFSFIGNFGKQPGLSSNNLDEVGAADPKLELKIKKLESDLEFKD